MKNNLTSHNTERYIVVMGISAGYFNNELVLEEDDISKLQKLWQDVANDYFKKNNIYVSAVSDIVTVIYNEDWGCPKSGEKCIRFTCTRNPKFNMNSNAFRNAVKSITQTLQNILEQETCTIEEESVKLTYVQKQE